MIIVDIPRASQGKVSYQALEKLKDRAFFSTMYEPDMVILPDNVHVICFANAPPDFTQMSLDRWIVRQVVDSELVVTSPANEWQPVDFVQ